MNKNGDNEGLAGGGLSDLISSLFTSILLLAQELKLEGNAASESKNRKVAENQETKEAASIRRDRESVDAQRLSRAASLNYDTELPEAQQANTLKRA